MLNAAENIVRIEGLLSEIKLEKKTFNKKDATGAVVQMPAIGGTISVKVNQELPNGEVKVLEVPVHMFAAANKNDGNPNPAYSSIEKIMTTYNSIAAVGEDMADGIRITGGQIQMNEYYSQNTGKLVSFPRISASFVNKVAKNDLKPCATFSAVFVVGEADYILDKDGCPTDKFRVRGILPQWGGKVDVVDFIAANENVANAIQSTWEQGQTVKGSGRLNFSSETKTVTKEVAFGDPVEESRTFSISELVLTGGSEPMEGEFAYDAGEIQTALAERKARLEESKNKSTNQASKVTPAPAQKAGFDNLGF